MKKNQIKIIQKGESFKVGTCPCIIKFSSKPIMPYMKELISESKFEKKYKKKIEKNEIILVKKSDKNKNDRNRSRSKDKIDKHTKYNQSDVNFNNMKTDLKNKRFGEFYDSKVENKEKNKICLKNYNESEKKWLKISSSMPEEERIKFLKLMGVKDPHSYEEDEDLIQASKTSEKYRKMNKNLEESFNKNHNEFRNRMKKKSGLGFKH